MKLLQSFVCGCLFFAHVDAVGERAARAFPQAAKLVLAALSRKERGQILPRRHPAVSMTLVFKQDEAGKITGCTHNTSSGPTKFSAEK